MALFLVAINVILEKLGNGLKGPLFTDDLAIYIYYNNKPKSGNKSTADYHQQNRYMSGSKERTNLSTSKTINIVFRKKGKKLGTNRNRTKKPNHTQ